LSSVRRTIKELRSAVGRECHRFEAAHPIYARKTAIIDTVKETQVSVEARRESAKFAINKFLDDFITSDADSGT